MNVTLPFAIGTIALLLFVLAVPGPQLATVRAEDSPSGRGTRGDLHTQGNPEEIRVTHLDLDLTVHFDRKELAGVAILDVERQPGVAERMCRCSSIRAG